MFCNAQKGIVSVGFFFFIAAMLLGLCVIKHLSRPKSIHGIVTTRRGIGSRISLYGRHPFDDESYPEGIPQSFT